jgi:hypothetical protein
VPRSISAFPAQGSPAPPSSEQGGSSADDVGGVELKARLAGEDFEFGQPTGYVVIVSL